MFFGCRKLVGMPCATGRLIVECDLYLTAWGRESVNSNIGYYIALCSQFSTDRKLQLTWPLPRYIPSTCNSALTLHLALAARLSPQSFSGTVLGHKPQPCSCSHLRSIKCLDQCFAQWSFQLRNIIAWSSGNIDLHRFSPVRHWFSPSPLLVVLWCWSVNLRRCHSASVDGSWTPCSHGGNLSV